jgi:excisionase family DNA binding protein
MSKPAGTSKVPTRIASIEQAANFAGCSQQTIRLDINERRLRGHRLGAWLVRVDLDGVEALLRPIPTIGTI